MKINTILPFLFPILIAGGLIGYNEMNNNVLLEKIQITKFIPSVLKSQENQNNIIEEEVQLITNVNQEIESSENTKIVDIPTAQSNMSKTITLENPDVLLINDNSVTLTNNNNGISINDIVVAGVLDNAPLGFLRKVVNISNINGNIVLETEKASLSDAYANQIVNPVESDTNTETGFNYTFQSSDLVKKENTEIFNTTDSLSNSELAKGFVLSEIPADAKCQVGLNNNYIVCTSLSELMDYFRNVPINPQELQYKNHTQIDYYPFPDREINKIPNRFDTTSSAGGQGNYKELKKSLINNSVGYFDINFEKKTTNTTTFNETDVSDKIEESLSEISNIVEKANFILDKVNYVRTLNDPKEINISEQDYTTFVSNYEYLINNSRTISQLKINETDLKKIQDAAAHAPIVISLMENS